MKMYIKSICLSLVLCTGGVSFVSATNNLAGSLEEKERSSSQASSFTLNGNDTLQEAIAKMIPKVLRPQLGLSFFMPGQRSLKDGYFVMGGK